MCFLHSLRVFSYHANVIILVFKAQFVALSQNKGTNPHTYQLDTYWDMMYGVVRKMEGAGYRINVRNNI